MKFFGLLFMSAALCAGALSPSAMAQEVIEVNNKFCPVDHKPVSGKDFAVYDGKKYGLDSGKCVNKFNKDPKTYAAKVILPVPGSETAPAEAQEAAKGFTEGV